MEILVNRGTVVEAETIEEALEKTKPSQGTTTSLNAVPRPAGVQGQSITQASGGPQASRTGQVITRTPAQTQGSK